MKSRFLAKLALASVLLFGIANAATISQPTQDVSGNVDGGQFAGQSFTATGNDTINSISVAPTAGATVTLRMYSGQTVCDNGGGTPTGGSTYTQTNITLTNGNPAGGDVTASMTQITLTTPQSITSGQQYTFCFEQTAGSLSLACDNVNPYAGGQAYSTPSFRVNRDFAFIIPITPTVSAVSTSALASTSVTLNATSDTTGTGYWVVLPSASAAPSAAQVAQGKDSTGTAVALSGNSAMTATVSKAFSITGLTVATSYKVYFVAQASGINSTVSSLTFITPPAVTFFSTSPGSTTADINATSNATGTGYWVALSSGASAPSATQVVAGQDGTGTTVALRGSFAMTATVQQGQSFSGLARGATYTVYFVAQANTANSAVSSATFTTSPADPKLQGAATYSGPKEINQNTLSIASSGNNQYTVDWSNAGTWGSDTWFEVYANGVLMLKTAPGARSVLLDLSNPANSKILRAAPNIVVCAVNQNGSSCQQGPIGATGNLLLILGLMGAAAVFSSAKSLKNRYRLLRFARNDGLCEE